MTWRKPPTAWDGPRNASESLTKTKGTPGFPPLVAMASST